MPWSTPSELEAERPPYTHLDAARDLALNTSLTITEATTVIDYLPPQLQADLRPAIEHLCHLFGGYSLPVRAGALSGLLKAARG